MTTVIIRHARDRPQCSPTERRPGIALVPFRPDDLPEVVAMLRRCSPETLLLRFHGATDGTFHARDLAAGGDHQTLAAWVGGECIGIATLAPGDGSWDLGVLVEDRWQRRGIGSMLTAGLADLARARDIFEVHAEVLGTNGWVVGMLSRIGNVAARVSFGVYSVTVWLS